MNRLREERTQLLDKVVDGKASWREERRLDDVFAMTTGKATAEPWRDRTTKAMKLGRRIILFEGMIGQITIPLPAKKMHIQRPWSPHSD